MPILITGADGYIVSRLLETIAPSADIFLHMRDAASAQAHRAKGWNVVTGDLIRGEGFAALPEGIGCVLHTAALFRGDANHILKNNILSTFAVVRFMEERHIPAAIFLSSAAVYGETSLEHPATEADTPNPLTPYGTSKLVGEYIFQEAHARGFIRSAIILRCANVYGPGLARGMMYDLAHCALKGQPMRIDGDGSQVRELIYIDDVLSALAQCMRSAQERSDVSIYNISGGEPMEVRQLAQMIAGVSGTRAATESSGKPAGLPYISRMAINHAKKDLSWAPRTVLKDGLVRMLERP